MIFPALNRFTGQGAALIITLLKNLEVFTKTGHLKVLGRTDLDD